MKAAGSTRTGMKVVTSVQGVDSGRPDAPNLTEIPPPRRSAMSLTRTKPLLIVTGLTAALALSSCAGSSAQKAGDAAAGGGGGMVAQLTFPSEADATVGGLANYNPYAPKPLTTTWLYEQLIVRNALTCEETPWLAEKATWEDGKKLTFDIRQGV